MNACSCIRIRVLNSNCITFVAQVSKKKAELEAIRFQTLGEIAWIKNLIKENIESTQREMEAMRKKARNNTSLVANSEKQVIHAHTIMLHHAHACRHTQTHMYTSPH